MIFTLPAKHDVECNMLQDRLLRDERVEWASVTKKRDDLLFNIRVRDTEDARQVLVETIDEIRADLLSLF